MSGASLFRTIVVDPPWRINRPNGWGKGTSASTTYMPYPLLTIDEIASLPIGELADASAHLYLWTVNRYVPDAYSLVKEWGFAPSTLLTWVKPPRGMGPGGHYASTVEFILFARRGVGERNPSVRSDRSHFEWERGVHSQKPDAFYQLAERISPEPRLDVFARKARPGWTIWGDEVQSEVPLLDLWRARQKELGG